MKTLDFARAGVLTVALATLVSGVRADEEKVALKDVPKAVLDAVKAKFPKAELTEAAKETEDGKTTYEVALKNDGHKVEVGLTAEGTIQEIETEVAVKDLPKAVSAAVTAKYPDSTFKKAESITRFEAGKESKNYEVVVATKTKKSVEVTVSPEGKVVKTEDED